MKSPTLRWCLAGGCVAAVLGIFLSINPADKAAARGIAATALPVPTPAANSSNTIKVTASGGLRVATFPAKSGRVLLILPDDMRAGDTISGTVSVEPDGSTEAERAKNLDVLKGHNITLWPKPAPKTPDGGIIRIPVKEPTFTFQVPPLTDPSSPGQGFSGFNATLAPPLAQGSGNLPPGESLATGSAIAEIHGGLPLEVRVDVSGQSAPIEIPPLGQQGRPVEIFGPFDGDATNTALSLKYLPDQTDRTPGYRTDFGIRPLAESPRKIVFESPTNFTGPAEIVLKERDIQTRGPYRNVGVRLSAPKTNLTRGERTTLTVEVTGLQGIKTDVPLQLDSKGVITMDGGNFQNLRIKPAEVTLDGRYTTNRAITGVQPGGFNVTATVIVNRFDFCIQDDTDPNRLFHFNSFTGDYVFACGGGSCRPGGSTGGTQTGGTTGKPGGTTQPGGTVQPGGTTQPGGTGPPPIQPSGTTLTGIGRPAMKGCIITLSHNAPDRRVFARLDTCTKSGDASVETTTPKTKINITDKNTADNTAASPPK